MAKVKQWRYTGTAGGDVVKYVPRYQYKDAAELYLIKTNTFWKKLRFR